MNKISVVIPTYNRMNEITKSVDSVVNQTLQPDEIIIVDDGSVDDTEFVINNYINSNPNSNIRYFKKENGGASSARNYGIMKASNSIIAFHDSDDIWRSNKLEVQMEYWNSHPEYSMIYCAFTTHYDDHKDITHPNDAVWGNLEGDIQSTLLVNNTIGAPTILAYKDALIACGMFDESLRCLEDWEMVIRFAQKYQIGYVNEILVDAYQHFMGVSSNTASFYEIQCRIIAQNKDYLITNNLFDKVVSTLFSRAQKTGCLPEVQKILMIYLRG